MIKRVKDFLVFQVDWRTGDTCIAMRVGEVFMLVSRLSDEIESRLDWLAKQTAGTKTICTREAILAHRENREEYGLSEETAVSPW